VYTHNSAELTYIKNFNSEQRNKISAKRDQEHAYMQKIKAEFDQRNSSRNYENMERELALTFYTYGVDDLSEWIFEASNMNDSKKDLALAQRTALKEKIIEECITGQVLLEMYTEEQVHAIMQALPVGIRSFLLGRIIKYRQLIKDAKETSQCLSRTELIQEDIPETETVPKAKKRKATNSNGPRKNKRNKKETVELGSGDDVAEETEEEDEVTKHPYSH